MSVVLPINPDPRFRLSTAVGGETSYSVPFPFQDNRDIALVRYGIDGSAVPQIEGVHYTLTGAGNPAGGTATLTAPMVAGERMLRVGRAVVDRVTSIIRNGRFNSDALDSDLDRWIIIAQELARESTRGWKAPYGQVGGSIFAGLAGTVPKFDPAGNLVEGPDGGEIEHAQEYAEQAHSSQQIAQSAADRAENAASSFVEVRTNFKTISLLEADVTMGYAGTGAPVVVEAGDVIVAGGVRFEALLPDAAGYHNQNANGVKVISFPDGQGYYLAAAFGVREANADNTPIFDRMASVLPGGSKILYPPKSVIRGHFLSPEKSFFVDGNGCSTIDTQDNQPHIGIGRHNATPYAVVEAELTYGERNFTVDGADALFAVGDIGYLWDGSRRPSDNQGVNYEVVKIASLSGDTVTIEGWINSHFGVQDGSIIFCRSSHQIKDAGIVNVYARPTNTHTAQILSIWNCEGVVMESLDCQNSAGTCFDVRYSYDIRGVRGRPRNPRAIAGGEGYGFQVHVGKKVRVLDIKGKGMRHILDLDSVYDFVVEDINDEAPANLPVVLSHNGFAGNGVCRRVKSTINAGARYLVGITTAAVNSPASTRPLKVNHPFRNIDVIDVDQVVDASLSVADADVYAVYIQNDWSGSVKGIRQHYQNDNPPSALAGGIPLRIDGVPVGAVELSNISTNVAGRMMVLTNQLNGAPSGRFIAQIRNINCSKSAYLPLAISGGWAVNIDEISLDEVVGDNVIQLSAANGASPSRCDIGPSIRTAVLKTIVTSSTAVTGSKAKSVRGAGSGIAVANGASITATQLQNSDARLSVVPPLGAGSITLNSATALPPPMLDGAACEIVVPAGYNDVVFPAGNNIHTGFTISAGNTTSLVSYAGKWAALRQ